jgi:hypothetical protein
MSEPSGTFRSSTNSTFTLARPRLYCPVCHTEDGEGANPTIFPSPGFVAPRITVTIAPYEGEYCQTCYAKWLHEHIPKLIPLAAGGAVALAAMTHSGGFVEGITTNSERAAPAPSEDTAQRHICQHSPTSYDEPFVCECGFGESPP